jgi:hypothetical protein
MKMKRAIPFLFLFSVTTTFAQKKLKVVRATSTSVDIKDDNYPIRKNAWTVMPNEKLDVYTTSAKKVTFYTDQESISFNIDPKPPRNQV